MIEINNTILIYIPIFGLSLVLTYLMGSYLFHRIQTDIKRKEYDKKRQDRYKDSIPTADDIEQNIEIQKEEAKNSPEYKAGMNDYPDDSTYKRVLPYIEIVKCVNGQTTFTDLRFNLGNPLTRHYMGFNQAKYDEKQLKRENEFKKVEKLVEERVSGR